MIVHRMEQGTPEWLLVRLGIPTASRFDSIITPAKREYSKASAGYRHELLAEWILGEPLDQASSGFMERGKELEPDAVRAYEFLHDVDVDRVGFVTNDAGTVGCSPDGLVLDDGGLEIKCFGPAHHVACLLGSEIAKMTQVQGGLWICERDWWDTFGFHPSMPHVLTRVGRDEAFIADLEAGVGRFLEELEMAKDELRTRGIVPGTALADFLADKAVMAEMEA
jgi:hypothetical protein